MIVEVRSYRVTPGRREEFIQFFETRAVPALRAHGMKVLGPLLDLENPNKFVWLRSFPSLEERDRIKKGFYEGELWKNELESIAMPIQYFRLLRRITAMQFGYHLGESRVADAFVRIDGGAFCFWQLARNRLEHAAEQACSRMKCAGAPGAAAKRAHSYSPLS